MKSVLPVASGFDDRARAHQRLDAVDNLGSQRLRDRLWPAEDSGSQATSALTHGRAARKTVT